MINELLNSILTCVLIADVIERRFPSEFQSFVVEISYNCIYLFSKFQIFLSNSNTKLNNIIDNNNTLLKIKSDIKHLLKPTIPTIPIAQEFIKDGKQVELLNEGLFYGSETDYDFSIVIKSLVLAQARSTNFVAAIIVQYAIVSDSRGPPTVIC